MRAPTTRFAGLAAPPPARIAAHLPDPVRERVGIQPAAPVRAEAAGECSQRDAPVRP